jgi:photosystem II stability/assembly factor-like uncharacterized protein
MSKRLLLTIALTCFIVMQGVAQDYEWKVISRPSNISLNYVLFTDTLNGLIFEPFDSPGGIRLTSDGGATWPKGDSLIAMVPKNITMLTKDTGWAIGDDGGEGKFYFTTDNWRSHSLLYDRLYQLIEGAKAFSRTRAVAFGRVRHPGVPDTLKQVSTTDGGVTWNERTMPIDSTYPGGIDRVFFLDSLRYFISGNDTHSQWYMLQTSDAGQTWKRIPGYGIRFMTFVDSLNGFGTGGGNLERSTDGGRTWVSRSLIDINADLIALTFLDTLNGWAFGGTVYQGYLSEGIYKTTDGGFNWQEESVGLSDEIASGMMFDKTHGWAVTYDGYVLAYRPKTMGVQRLPETPKGFNLRQNYPNPFNPTTTIEYELPQRSLLSISIYDLTGRLVKTLINESQEAGVYRLEFTAIGLSSGTYFYTLRTPQYQETKSMVILK